MQHTAYECADHSCLMPLVHHPSRADSEDSVRLRSSTASAVKYRFVVYMGSLQQQLRNRFHCHKAIN